MHRLRQETSAKEQAKFPFSNLEATVRLFDEAVAVHLIQNENHGTIIPFDPERTQVVRGFVRECLDRL